MNEKASAFVKFVGGMPGEDGFNVEEVGDEFHTALLRTRLEIGDGCNVPLMVLLDDTIYSLVRVWAAHAVVTEGNRIMLLQYMNQMNGTFKTFKYYDSEDGDVVIDVVVPVTAKFFDPKMIITMIEELQQHLHDTYEDLQVVLSIGQPLPPEGGATLG